MYTEAIGVQMYNGDRIPFADLKARTETENEYDPNSTYALGEACTHEGKTYVANTAISTAEAWNSAHWDESNIVTLYNELNSKLTKLNWTNFTVGDDSALYAQYNGIVFIRIHNISLTANTSKEVGSLPSTLRPSLQLHYTLVGGGNRNYIGEIEVNTNGKVILFANTTASYWGCVSVPII